MVAEKHYEVNCLSYLKGEKGGIHYGWVNELIRFKNRRVAKGILSSGCSPAPYQNMWKIKFAVMTVPVWRYFTV